jgi:phage-related protein (TIGR01555 family)
VSRKRLKDRVDGYSPPDYKGDFWSSAEARRQMRERIKQDQLDERERMDAFKNELTGVGDFLRDKTMGGRAGGLDFVVNLISNVAAENRWRGSDLGARIIETVPDEMTREGFDVEIQPSDEDDKTDAFTADPGADPMAMVMPPAPQGPKPVEINDEWIQVTEELDGILEEMGADTAVAEALCYERAYGGGAILLGAQDGFDDLAKPLDEKRIEEVSHLTPLSGGWDGEVVAWSYYNDPAKPNYGMPETYMMRNLGVPIARIPAPGEKLTPQVVDPMNATIRWVHESRLLVFPGVAPSRRARVQMRGWGDSIFTRVDEVLQHYGQTWGGIAIMMSELSIGVLSVDGLAAALVGNNKAGTKTVTNRALALNIAKSIARVTLIDAKEKFQRDTVSMAGVAEMMQQFALRLAAAAGMPVSMLMGQAPAGLNATGDSEIRWFYDKIAAAQRRRVLPQLRKLIRLIFLSKDGPTNGKEPERWSVKARPLYQMSATEKAQRYLTIAQADQIYLANSVVSAEEVAAKRFGGSDYDDGPIVLDLDGRAEMAAQQEQQAQAQQQAMAAAASAPAATNEGEPNGGDQGGDAPFDDGSDDSDAIAIEPDVDDIGLDDKADDFNEADHPRAEDGKFGSGGGGASPKTQSATDLVSMHKAAAKEHRAKGEHAQAEAREALARSYQKSAAQEKRATKKASSAKPVAAEGEVNGEVAKPAATKPTKTAAPKDSGATPFEAPKTDLATLKKEGVDAAVKEAGGNPKQVNGLVQDWGDHGGTEGAIELRAAWAAASGQKISDDQMRRMVANHRQFKRDLDGEDVSHDEAAKVVTAAIAKGHSVQSMDNAKAIASVSQAAYGDATHVDVYRGITGAQAQQVRDAIARGDKTIKLSVDATTSFTDSHGAAKSFARGEGGQGNTGAGGQRGVVVKMNTPVSSVVMSHKAFSQLSGENEVVVSTGGVLHINADDISLL